MVAQGAPTRRENRTYLGGNCRVGKDARKKLEKFLVKFVVRFATYVNKCKDLDTAIEQYIMHHQQYFDV